MMNYSKNLKKTAIMKRVIIMCGIAAIVFFIIGSVVGYVLKTHITAKSEQNTKQHGNEPEWVENIVYGAYKDSNLAKEVTYDWVAGDLDFTPLDVSLNEEIQEFTYYLCAGYNLDFALVMSLMQYESSYQLDAISKSDDYGVMQINKMNHEWLTETIGVTDYLDPYQNIRAGCFILRKLFEENQDVAWVLMAYNLGEDGADKLWTKGVYGTDYAKDILAIQQQLNEQLKGETDAEKLESN